MKKIFYFVAALALFACEKADLIDQPAQGGIASGADLPEVIYATVDRESDDATTRTYADGKSILWHGGDAITYIGHDAFRAKYQYDGEDGVSSASFTYKETGNVPTGAVKPEIPFAVYPYGSGAYCKQVDGVNTLVVNFPAEQTYAENSFGRGANVMVGVGATADDTDFYFRNACGYLVIKLLGDDVSVKSIELTALGGEGLSGTGYISASRDAAPVVTMDGSAKSTVTLNCGDGVVLNATTATEFWFALPPVTFSEGFKMFVTLTQGAAFEMQTSKRVDIVRNDIQPMAELQYAPNAQAPNQLFYTMSENSTATLFDKLKVGEDKYFNAAITAHYFDTRINKYIIECAAPITQIKDDAFNQAKITSVSLPNQLETIGEYAFQSTSLKSLVIPGSVTLIDNYAFYHATALKSISFLEGDRPLEIRFKNTAFSDTQYAPFDRSSLTYIYLNRDINYTNESGGERSYGSDLDQEGSCQGLFALYVSTSHVLELEIGPKVTTILPMMFDRCPIVDLVIPGTVNTIGYDAFCDLAKLETVTFLPSPTNTPLSLDAALVVSWGDYPAFYRANEIREVNINREINYTLTDIDSSEGIFSDKSKLTTVTLGEQAKKLSKYMFYNCDNLTSVTLSEGLTTIDYGAFYDCSKLPSISIPASVTTMGDYVFYNCDKLTTATLAGQTIGMGAFDSCDGLTTVIIENTVKTIGYNAFRYCTSLATVNIKEGTETLTLGNQLHNSAWWATFYDSPLTSVTCKREIDYRASDGSVYPLNEWGDGVFASKCSNLTSISLGGGLRNILPYMFGKAKVSGVWIPHTIESIGDKAFYDCDNLSGLTLGYDGTTKFPSIGEGVFSECSKSSDIFIKVREGVYEGFMDKANNNELGWGAYKNKIITGPYN